MKCKECVDLCVKCLVCLLYVTGPSAAPRLMAAVSLTRAVYHHQWTDLHKSCTLESVNGAVFHFHPNVEQQVSRAAIRPLLPPVGVCDSDGDVGEERERKKE